MALEPQPVPRPDWSPLPYAGCTGVEGKVLLRVGDLGIALLRFSPGGTIHEHSAPFPVDVICLEGEGLTSVGAEEAPLRAGQSIRWPADRPHRLWTTTHGMTTLMVEHPLEPARKSAKESPGDLAVRLQDSFARLAEVHRRAVPRDPMMDEDPIEWDVDRWIAYFEQHDREMNPLLAAMQGREDTAENIRQAMDEAARVDQEIDEILEEAEPIHEEIEEVLEANRGQAEEASEPFDEVEDADDAGDDHPGGDRWTRLEALCPACGQAREFAKTLTDFMRSAPPNPILTFVHSITTAQIVGVSMGLYHQDEVGTPHPLRARFRIAAGGFRRIARTLARFPDVAPGPLAAAAGEIAEGFARAERDLDA